LHQAGVLHLLLCDARNHETEAQTCFCAVTPSSGSALFVLTNVTVVKIFN